jgi:hypothetical protein
MNSSAVGRPIFRLERLDVSEGIVPPPFVEPHRSLPSET